MRWFLTLRHLPLVLAGVAMALGAPTLNLGLQGDDHLLRAALIRPSPVPEAARTPIDLFAFFPGGEGEIRGAIDAGRLPWWTARTFRATFLRPVSGFTHWLDFRLWPAHPWAMHLQSLLWFGAAVATAAVRYRRLLRPVWFAGLAALLFAVDDAHGLPAAWLSNRNALIASLFGLLALLAHDRWRRGGWRAGAVGAPLAFLIGLLAGEIALATAAYLVAYALFVDEDRWGRRLASLLPAGAVGAAWWVVYRTQGYGVDGSAMYIDPGAQPAEYAHAVLERAPLLLLGQWALPPDFLLALSQPAARASWWAACGVVVGIAALLLPLLRRDRTARFFALGMVLSLLPVCATFPSDRLLFLAGFGGMGLLAQLLAAVGERAAWLPHSLAWRVPARAAWAVLLVFHVLIAPLVLVGASARVRSFGEVIQRAASSLPADPPVREQWVLIVNTPTAFVSIWGPLIQRLQERPGAARSLVLGSGIHRIEILRLDERSIRIRPEGGFLALPGAPRPGHEAAQPAFDMRYMFPLFDRLYRDASPMRRGERIELTGVTVEIEAVTADGRPAAATFRFDRSLADSSLRWLQWRHGVYVPFALPAVGEPVTLPPVTLAL